jgi:hypothetical protein
MHTAMVFLVGYVLGCFVMVSALYICDLFCWGDDDEQE